MKNKILLVNKIRTPDGTIIQSKNRHDYVTYTDKNGATYMVDGGCNYLKRNYFPDNRTRFQKIVDKVKKFFGLRIRESISYIEESLYNTDSIKELREWIYRAGFGKDGRCGYREVLLKNMSNSWIDNVIEYEENLRPTNKFISVFYRELQHRIDNSIYIEDNE